MSQSQKYMVFLLATLFFGSGCGSDDVPVPVIPPSNHAPVLRPQADTTITVGDTLHLWAVADDFDGDPLIYGAAALSTWGRLKGICYPCIDIDFEPSNGHFIFHAQARRRMGQDFQFTVADPRGGRDSTTFTVFVEE